MNSNKSCKKILKQSHGDRIRLLQDFEHKTQEQLAEILGVGSKTISRIENGEGILSGASAIKLYLLWGYLPDWIYGISEIPKDTESVYRVDIRNIFEIKNGKVNITIPKYLFELLARKDEVFSRIETDESQPALLEGVHKQMRALVYSHNKKEFCCASIDTEQFTIREDTKQQ